MGHSQNGPFSERAPGSRNAPFSERTILKMVRSRNGPSLRNGPFSRMGRSRNAPFGRPSGMPLASRVRLPNRGVLPRRQRASSRTSTGYIRSRRGCSRQDLRVACLSSRYLPHACEASPRLAGHGAYEPVPGHLLVGGRRSGEAGNAAQFHASFMPSTRRGQQQPRQQR